MGSHSAKTVEFAKTTSITRYARVRWDGRVPHAVKRLTCAVCCRVLTGANVTPFAIPGFQFIPTRPTTSARAKKVLAVPTVRIRLTSVHRYRVFMAVNVWTTSTITTAPNAPRDFPGRIVRTQKMSAHPVLARTEELAKTWLVHTSVLASKTPMEPTVSSARNQRNAKTATPVRNAPSALTIARPSHASMEILATAKMVTNRLPAPAMLDGVAELATLKRMSVRPRHAKTAPAVRTG